MVVKVSSHSSSSIESPFQKYANFSKKAKLVSKIAGMAMAILVSSVILVGILSFLSTPVAVVAWPLNVFLFIPILNMLAAARVFCEVSLYCISRKQTAFLMEKAYRSLDQGI